MSSNDTTECKENILINKSEQDACKLPCVLEFTPFNKDREVVIEEIWNLEMRDELIVFGYVRSSIYIIPETISYSCLAFYAEGNALDRDFDHYYEFDADNDTLFKQKFTSTFKCIKLGVLNSDDELNEIENEDKREEEDKYVDDKLNKMNKENVFIGCFVVKKLKKSEMNKNDIESIQKQIKLLKYIRILQRKCIYGSQFIIKLIDLFEDNNHSYIINNYCNRDNLWKYVHRKKKKVLGGSENILTKNIMKQILSGVAFLQKYGILHLALNPWKILLHENENDDIYVQIINFFDSKCIDKETNNRSGPIKISDFMYPNFIPPEILIGFYNIKSDIWSLGAIFFLLKFGHEPFFIDDAINDDDHDRLYAKIKKGFNPIDGHGFGAWFPKHIHCDENLKDLIKNMLKVDISKRFSIQQCLNHSFFDF